MKIPIFNDVASNNSLIQNEIKELVERFGVNIFQPTVTRKLKKMNLSRKRLSLVSI